MERFLEIHMYITAALEKTDMRAVGLQLAMDLLYEKVSYTHTHTHTHTHVCFPVCKEAHSSSKKHTHSVIFHFLWIRFNPRIF